jgi:hypothetical protein
VIVSRIVQLSSLLAHQRQSTVLTLSTSLSNGVSANGRRFPTHTRATRFGTVPALKTVAMLRIDQEAAMWKITTRGFTLEEVLIMAAMNLLENAASTPKPEKRHCRNYKETKHGTEVLDKTSGSRSERFGTRIHHRSRAVKPIRN